jgi:phosphoglucosamine mutase
MALGGEGRILVRYSGTEPLARVMVEGRDRALIEGLARRIGEEILGSIG